MGLGMAAAFGLAIGGFMVVENEPHGPLSTRVASIFAAPRTTDAKPNSPAEFPTRPAQEAAVALAPSPLISARAPSGEAAGLYASAVAKVEASDPQGAVDMRRAADLGYAPAEFYLARLYETGGDGISKDSAQARRWTQKAALAGDPRAMHNLGLYEFQGSGGPANAADAVQWFHRAAELGLEDSQYNLARLYEEGLGVPQNTAEAYKWYLIAARDGDPQAKAGAARARAGLSAAARAVAEQAAAQFRSVGGPEATATAQSPTASPVATAQKALLALGYYQGPTDGVSSPALGLAISAYQRDQGLPTTGATDAATMGKLAALAN
ncbi:MAG: SEL1-like repeat protein [Caulobacteraceae bacterium]